MKSAVETLNPTRVKLTVEVPYEELAPSVDAAYKTISSQVAIPGFRKGKVPPRIIDQRLGRGTVLQEAVNSALPGFYARAMEESEVRPMGQPEVEVTDVPEGTDGDLRFTVEVDVRPEIDLPEMSEIEVVVDEVAVEDADVDERIDALRERFGTLVPADRAAAENDFVTLDLVATIDDEEIDSAKGISYQIGSGTMLEGMDDALLGLSAGETTTFDAPLAGGEQAGRDAHITVTLQAVKDRQLPEADDDFAQLASEFDTLEELRDSARVDVEKRKKLEQAMQARERLVELLLERLDIPVPEAVVEEEVTRHLESEDRVDDDEHRAEVQEETRSALRTRMMLDVLAERSEVRVEQNELVDYLIGTAQQYGLEVNRFVEAVNDANQMPAMVAEVARRKALAEAVNAATVKTEAGDVVDIQGFLTELAAEEEAARAQYAAAQAAAMGEGGLDDEDVEDDLEELDELETQDEQDAAGEAGSTDRAPAGSRSSAADPAAVNVSSVGGFVPDEPAS